MNRSCGKHLIKRRKSQLGISLVETVIALAVLLIVSAGVMGIAALALSTTENQGHLAARTAEYAQDKMEQLLALAYCDGGSTGTSGTDTTVFPATVGAGTGLAGCTNATPPVALTGGGVNPTAPVAGYVDYLDNNGNLVGAAANWEYIRVWQITIPAGTTNLKQITVTSQVRTSVAQAILPQSTIVTLKSYPF
ncbi:MAG: hypothetical protein PVS2B2_08580 [Candidatus Acidiferrum sp.]